MNEEERDEARWEPDDAALLADVDAALVPGGPPARTPGLIHTLATATPPIDPAFRATLRARLLASQPSPAGAPEPAVLPTATGWRARRRRPAPAETPELAHPLAGATYTPPPSRRARWGGWARGLAGAALFVLALAGLSLLLSRANATRPGNTGVPMFTQLRALEDGAGPVAWTPDGRLIAGLRANAVIIWDVSTGLSVRSMEVPAAISLAWSPDGQTLAVGTGGNGIWLMDPATGQRNRVLGQSPGTAQVPSEVSTVAWTPDGSLLATADAWHGITIWDTRTWAARTQIAPTRSAAASSLAWSPDGSRLAAMVGTSAHVWDVGGRDLATLGPLPPTPAPLPLATPVAPALWNRDHVLAWAADGRLALAGPGSLQVWDPTTGRTLQSFAVALTAANSPAPLAWWAGGRWLLGPPPLDATTSASAGGIWDPVTGRSVAVVPLVAPGLTAFMPSPDGRLLAVADPQTVFILGAPGALAPLPLIWSNTPTLVQVLPTETGGVPAASPVATLPPPNPTLALPASLPTAPAVVPPSPGTPILPPPLVTPTLVALAPARLVTPVHVLTMTESSALDVEWTSSFTSTEPVRALAWAPGGDRLVYLTLAGRLYARDLNSNTLQPITLSSPVPVFAFLGNRLALGDGLVLPGSVVHFPPGQPAVATAAETLGLNQIQAWSATRASGIRFGATIGGDTLVTVDAAGQAVAVQPVPYMASAAVQSGGSWLAYVTSQQTTDVPLHDPAETLYLLNLHDGQRLQMSTPGGGHRVYSWSPDGHWLLADACDTWTCGGTLISADGRVREVIAPQIISDLADAMWSPDSRYVAFSARRGGCEPEGCTPDTSDLYIVDVQAGHTARVGKPGGAKGGYAQLEGPAWAPNGHQLAALTFDPTCPEMPGCSQTAPAIWLFSLP